jgi:hypothetical protein
MSSVRTAAAVTAATDTRTGDRPGAGRNSDLPQSTPTGNDHTPDPDDIPDTPPTEPPPVPIKEPPPPPETQGPYISRHADNPSTC